MKIGWTRVGVLFFSIATPRAAGAISLPDSSSCTAGPECFKITNNGSSGAIRGSASSGDGVRGDSGSYGVHGVSTSSTGVYGEGSTGVSGSGTANQSGALGVYGIGRTINTGGSSTGVAGVTASTGGNSSGVYGQVPNNGLGQAIWGQAGGSWTAWAGNYDGDVQARGFYSTSDVRLKKEIKDAPYGLRELLQLRPVTYRWKTGAEHPAQNGLIAQEVQKVFPSAIRVDHRTGMLAVDYIALVPVAIRSIQQQQASIARLEARVVELESRSPAAAASFSVGAVASWAAVPLLPLGIVAARRRKRLSVSV